MSNFYLYFDQVERNNMPPEFIMGLIFMQKNQTI